MTDLARPAAAANLTSAAAGRLLITARSALAEADTLPEIVQLVDRAEVIRVAARRAKLSRDAQNDWGEYKLDAERKAGQRLKELERRPAGNPHRNSNEPLELTPQAAAVKNAGITPMQASRWELLASLPEPEYEAFKAEVRADTEKVITQSAALAVAKHHVRERQKVVRETERARLAPGRAVIEHAGWETWLPGQPQCDLLITDPPYSTDVEDIAMFARQWLPRALGMVKPTGRAYVCIGAYPAELAAYLSFDPGPLTLANVLVWTYRNTLGPRPTLDYKLNWQAILYYRGPQAPPLDCPEMVEQFSVQDINAPDGRLGDRWHAWQKPDALAERLVRHSTKPGDLVLDPFAGTGTFLLAAARLGRDARGCDVDAGQVATAVERGCGRA